MPLAKERCSARLQHPRRPRVWDYGIGCVAQQSPRRLHNRLPSRSDGCGQGRPKPARIAREPLTASRSAGYRCARHLTYYSNRTPGPPSTVRGSLSYTLELPSRLHLFLSAPTECRPTAQLPVWPPFDSRAPSSKSSPVPFPAKWGPRFDDFLIGRSVWFVQRSSALSGPLKTPL